MQTQGIILSAGESSRMGQPKALLEVEGESFLGRLQRIFGEAGIEALAVVVGGRHQLQVLELAASLGLEGWVNPDPRAGPISSVRTALERCPRASALFLHPVDIPGVRVEDVRLVMAGAEEHPHADAIIPSVHMKRAHPILLRRSLDAPILNPELESLRELWRMPEVQIVHVESDNEGLLRDVDTPADYQRLLGPKED